MSASSRKPSPPSRKPASHLPPRSSTYKPTIPSSSSSNSPPKTPAGSLDYETILRSPSWQRFRSAYLAVGVAVIAASGALFGAHLKTAWQDWRANDARRKIIAATTTTSSGAATGKDIGGEDAGEGRRLLDEGTPQRKNQSEVMPQPEISLADLNRSIASLETVRGQLVRKRQQEETKLGNLRERILRKREAEGRREEAVRVAAQQQQRGEGEVVR